MTLQSENTIRVGEIATNLQAIRRAILRYAFDHDEKSYTEAETRLKKAGDLLVEADKTTKSEERRATYKEVNKDIEELKTKRLALGEAVKQLVAGAGVPVQRRRQDGGGCSKIRRCHGKDRFCLGATLLEAKVLLVRVANWRMLATRDAKGLATFKANAEKAQAQIAVLERRTCRQTSPRC